MRAMLMSSGMPVELAHRSLWDVVPLILAPRVACKAIFDQGASMPQHSVNSQTQAVKLEAIFSAAVLHQHSGGK